MLVTFNGAISTLDIFQCLYPWLTLNDVSIATDDEIDKYININLVD